MSTYQEFYEQELLPNYNKYSDFLATHDLLDSHWNFKEEDILTLMIIKSNKEQIIEAAQTRNQISSFYFRNEDAKYLRKSVSLSKAILKVLGLSSYPEEEKDQQYIICVQTKRPKLILLCENIDKLRLPEKFRNADVELWYAGGKNISKLASIRENEKLPFWYVCDWDHDGLMIYKAIKRDYLPEIKLVIPEQWKNDMKPIGDHKSLWSDLSSYDLSFFVESEVNIVQHLISNNTWIEEEGFDVNLDQILRMT